MKILICDKCKKEDKGIKTIKQITLIGLSVANTHSPTYELCGDCQLELATEVSEFFKFNKGHQPKDEEYPPLADNSKIGL